MKIHLGWERRKDDLREELETHLRLAIEERVARGESPEEARVSALREMGNPPLIVDVTREQWGWVWCERLAHDLRHALRQLRKSPGYTATALVTLTLAIGANTAIFGLLYALLLRSLPVERPDQIVQIKMLMTGPSGKGEPEDSLSGKTYDVLAEHQTLMSGLCAWGGWALNLRDASGTHPVPTAMLTGDCFETLGLHAALGRLFNQADDKLGGGPGGYAVVLGYNYWRNQMGRDPSVLGRVLDFQDKKGVVVGVMEPGFESVKVGDRPSIYVPSEIDDGDRHNLGSMNRLILGRLRNGVTPAQVQAQIDPIFVASLGAEMEKLKFFSFDSEGHQQMVTQMRLVVVPGRTGSSYLRSEYGKPLYLIEGMVGLSLLVACAYLATLAASRALARRRELAVRVALGASRARLAAQLCYESLLLSMAGAALGLLFAWGAGRVLVRMIDFPGSQGLSIHTAPTGMVLLFTLGLTVLTVILAGVGPAWRASHVDPVNEIKEGELKLSRRRARRIGAWLVPVQIGLSLVIVVVAALMATTVARLLAVDPGFRAGGVTFTAADFSERARLSPDKPKSTDEWKHASIAIYLALLDKIRHSPGVESASLAQAHQLGGSMYFRSASSTLPSGEVREGQLMLDLMVAPDYFRTLGIPMLAGRDFTNNDKEGAPEVCILSRSAAQYFFPGRDALGQTLTMAHPKQPVRLQVVGVVGDTLYMGLRGAAPQILYLPYFGSMGWTPYLMFAVRARDTAAGEAAVRNAFRELAPDVPLEDTVTMADEIQGAIGKERMVALLAGFFAALTLTLSAIGIYGLLNYSVVRRRTEIGVRMALGASRDGVVQLILREAFWMVLPGLALGTAGAWGATRFLGSLLYGVKPLDPWIFAASVAILAGAAALACVLPAHRAASVHPMQALRFE